MSSPKYGPTGKATPLASETLADYERTHRFRESVPSQLTHSLLRDSARPDDGDLGARLDWEHSRVFKQYLLRQISQWIGKVTKGNVWRGRYLTPMKMRRSAVRLVEVLCHSLPYWRSNAEGQRG